MKKKARKQQLVVGDKTYQLSVFSKALAVEFEEWAATQGMVDPLDMAFKKIAQWGAYPEYAKIIVKEATEANRSACKFGSPEMNALLKSPKGAAKFMHLLLREHHPEVTEEEAFRLTSLDESPDDDSFLEPT